MCLLLTLCKGKEKERDLRQNPGSAVPNLAKTEKKAFVGMLPHLQMGNDIPGYLLGTPLFLHLIHQAFSEPAGPADALMQRMLCTDPLVNPGLDKLLLRSNPGSVHHYPGAAQLEANPGYERWHQVFLAMCKQFIGPLENAGVEARKNSIPLVLEETTLAGKPAGEYYQALGWLLGGLGNEQVATNLAKYYVAPDQPLTGAQKAAARVLFLPLSHLQ